MTEPNCDKPSLNLYPPVVELPTFPPTWEDIERLSLSYPVVLHAVVMVRRGDWSREQALIMLAFALAQSFQKLFGAEVDRLARNPRPYAERLIIPGKPGYRIVWVDASYVVYEHCETKERIPIEQPALSFDRASFDQAHGLAPLPDAVDPAARDSTS